jgi:hypothetical protein
MATNDAQAGTTKAGSSSQKRWKFVLPWKYLLAIVVFYIINIVKVYFVVSHVDSTVKIPSIYDVLFILKLVDN